MQCYTELVPPSGVTHSVASSFVGGKTSNLIVARSSLLQIFKLKQVGPGQETKLVLLAESTLSGIVIALGNVKLLDSKSGGDALLVAFRDAKLSLIEWDPAHHSISTISIHYYENHDLLLCPWVPDLKNCTSRLSIDPSSRCAAFHFGVNNLAIIPFHQSADDLIMDDFDDIDSPDDDKPAVESDPHANGDVNGDANGSDKPYAPSFILPLTVIDPTLVHPVDMAFLHEYRQPTIGILYSVSAPSNNMGTERKDVLIYAVYSLEIEQRASTTLSSIPKLPNDLFKVVALPLPIGGTLLIGGNELIHIDQGGKANGLAVNEFAKEESSFAMSDKSELRLQLEGCQVEPVGNIHGDMLLILSSGDLAILTFRRDGRSVSGLSLQCRELIDLRGAELSRTSAMTNLGQGQLFVASEESDSVLLGPARQNVSLKRHTSRLEENGRNSDSDDDIDDDDDLYDDIKAEGANSHDENFVKSLTVFDTLFSIGPVNGTTFGRPSKRKGEDDGLEHDNSSSLELAMACGRGRAGALALLSRRMSPLITKRQRVQNAVGLWSMSTKPVSQTATKLVFHDTIIFSVTSDDGPGRSKLMSLSDGSLQPREGTDFDEDTMTIAAGRLSASNHTVQVSANDVRVYDSDFGLSQIFPIVDEDSGEIAQVVSAMCVEPFVCFVKDDQTLSLLKADESGELDEIDLPTNVPTTEVVSACLYCDTDDLFGSSRYNSTTNFNGPIVLCVLTKNGGFGIYPAASPKVQIFQYQGINFLPTQLAPDVPLPKHWKNPGNLSEILLADIGDRVHKTLHLAVRDSSGDVCLYLPYPVRGVEGSYRFTKVAHHNADVAETIDEEATEQSNQNLTQRLHVLNNIDSFSTVFIAGRSPSIIFKAASGRPHFQRLLSDEAKFVTGVHDSTCANGFIFIDESSNANFSILPHDVSFTQCDYSIRKVSLDEDVTGVSYHPQSSSYVLTTHTPTIFQLPQDDEWHSEWTEETTQFLPTTTTSHIKLLSPESNNVISTYTFDPSERVLTTRCLNIEISEETHEFADVIVVGTAIAKGENVVTRGNIYIFTVASVNPQPGVPESDKKLKLITKEDCRGSVSAITAIGSQGYFLAAQGQKCMVRGLKEDRSVLPVAFLDMRYHTHVARNLPGTGLTILGDAFSGLWLMGYSEEPYKMQILSRDFEDPECIAADFLPDGKQLFIVSADANGDLRFLEYDPENPKTERGAKLLLRSTFNTGSYQTNIILIPRTPTSSEILASTTTQALNNNNTNNDDNSPSSSDQEMADSLPTPSYTRHNLLLTSQTGSLSIITPLTTQSYRRLSTLQNILTAQLEQPCGLNPRAFRAVETDGVGGRGVIDGEVVKRWLLLSSWHKASLADKVGAEVWEVRRDIETVCGAGLGYL